METSESFFVLLAFFKLELCEFGEGEEPSAFGVEIIDVELYLFEFEFFAHLYAIDCLQRQVELLV